MLEFNNSKLNFLIGFIIIITCSTLIIIFMYFNNFSNKYNSYYIQSSNIKGVKNNTNIFLNGYKIGYLHSYYIDSSSLQVILHLKILKEIEITKDSIFRVITDNFLTNSKSINLYLGFDDVVSNGVMLHSQAGMDLDALLNLIEGYLAS